MLHQMFFMNSMKMKRWIDQKKKIKKSATTTNTCCLNVALMHSVKTVVTHFRLLRSSPNSDTRNLNCCIKHRHRPLLDSVGKGFQLKEKRKCTSSHAKPTRTWSRGAVNAL